MSAALLLVALAVLVLLVVLPGFGTGGQRVRTTRPHGAAGRERPLELEAEFYLPLPGIWRLEWKAAPRLGFSGLQAAGLGWGRVSVRLSAGIEPRRRGEFALPGARLFVRDVLGVFEREVRLDGETGRIYVYPRFWEQLPPELALTLLAEGPESPRVGLEDASRYRGAREYRPGDALRRIHWKATARRGELMVREFSWVRATGVWIYIDPRGSEVYLDHMAELAASLAVRWMDMGLSVGLAYPGFKQEPARGLEALRTMLAALARLESVEAASAPPLPPPGVNLIVLTQEAPPAVIEGALAARARAARVHLLAFPEGFFLRPGEKGRPVWGRTEGMVRLQQRRGLLHAEGVHVHVFRGNDPVRFG